MLKFLKNPFFDKWYIKLLLSTIINFIISVIFVFMFVAIYNIHFSIIKIFSMYFSLYISSLTILWFLANKMLFHSNKTTSGWILLLRLLWIFLFYISSGYFLGFLLKKLFPSFTEVIFDWVIYFLELPLLFLSSKIPVLNILISSITQISDVTNTSIIFMFLSSFTALYITTYYLAESSFKSALPFEEFYKKYILEKLGL